MHLNDGTQAHGQDCARRTVSAAECTCGVAELPQSGDPFPCPNCGETDAWSAHYKVPESQGVELFIGADGEPEEGEYDGMTESYDPDANEYYECDGCGTQIALDGTLGEWCAEGQCQHPAHQKAKA